MRRHKEAATHRRHLWALWLSHRVIRCRRQGARPEGVSRFHRLMTACTVAAGLAIAAGCIPAGSAGAASAGLPLPNPGFSYGFDFDKQAPDFAAWNNPVAVTSARQVMSSTPMVQDQAIMGWGSLNPEPAPGVYDFSELDARINLIEATGGSPVITLAGAPDWMKGGQPGVTDWNLLEKPPFASHYQDFANLAAMVALRYPEVKYFVVWKELHGFWNSTTNVYNIAAYTTLYNDVYRAIKAVRPDALVGGPYVSMISWSGSRGQSGGLAGSWGFLNEQCLNALSYWLTNSVGADFVAMDGQSYTRDAGFVTDPLSSTEKFAAVDSWLRRMTALPIWWMESPVQQPASRWSESESTAVRIGALVQMAVSGARVGMQWQPEEGAGIPGAGLWTSVRGVGGGQPTLLAQLVPGVMSILSAPVTLSPGEPPGVMVASGSGGEIAINATAEPVVVTVNGMPLLLSPDAVRVAPSG